MAVNINIDRGKYKLRWSHGGKRYSLNIGDINKSTLKVARAKSAQIEADILFERFDCTLAKYGKLISHADSTNILSAWERYKQANSKRVALTTQKHCWTTTDNCLKRITNKSLLEFDKADELVNHLLQYYSPGTLKRVLIDLNSAHSNYYSLKKLPTQHKPAIKCFTNSEIQLIIDCFADDRYKPKASRYSHSYYTNYVRFLAYTGCRPEEAIALTWRDVGNSTITINKAYSKGVLKATKNYKIRQFPINQQLRDVLNDCYCDSNLVLPSVTGKYINQKDWHGRYWKPVVSNLVAAGLLKEYLVSYCLRHSFITRCLRGGIDIATVAAISGNNSETIMRYYFAAHDATDISLPEC